MKQKTTDETALYAIGLSLAGLSLCLWLIIKIFPGSLEKYMLPCIFHSITGYYCPGCGGTRAAIALLHGKWIRSFICHPFVLYGVVFGVWFMVSQTIERISKQRWKIGMRYRDIYLWLALAIVIFNFIIKNIALFLGYDLLNMYI